MKKKQTVIGTGPYLSPLVYKSQHAGEKTCEHDVEKSDIFSLGITLLQLIFRVPTKELPSGEPEKR